MKEIIEKLRESLLKENNTQLAMPNEKFIEITKSDTESPIAFIDGGSAEIFNNVNMSFGIIRAAYAIFSSNKRTHSKTFDFYFLIKTQNKGNKMVYNAEIFNVSNKHKIMDETIFEFELKENPNGNHKTEITGISDKLRRLIEIRTASFIAENLSAGFIVIDTIILFIVISSIVSCFIVFNI